MFLRMLVLLPQCFYKGSHIRDFSMWVIHGARPDKSGLEVWPMTILPILLKGLIRLLGICLAAVIDQ